MMDDKLRIWKPLIDCTTHVAELVYSLSRNKSRVYNFEKVNRFLDCSNLNTIIVHKNLGHSCTICFEFFNFLNFLLKFGLDWHSDWHHHNFSKHLHKDFQFNFKIDVLQAVVYLILVALEILPQILQLFADETFLFAILDNFFDLFDRNSF